MLNTLDNQDCAYNPAEGRQMVMRTLMDPDALERCTGPREPRRPVPSLPSGVPCEATPDADVTDEYLTARHEAREAREARQAWGRVGGVGAVSLVLGVIVRLLP